MIRSVIAIAAMAATLPTLAAANDEVPRVWHQIEGPSDEWLLSSDTEAIYKHGSGEVVLRMLFRQCEQWQVWTWVKTSGSWKDRVDDGPIGTFDLCEDCDDYDPETSTDVAVSWSDQAIREMFEGQTYYVKVAGRDLSYQIPLAGLSKLQASAEQYCGNEMEIWKEKSWRDLVEKETGDE